jgi:hypothetical protein
MHQGSIRKAAFSKAFSETSWGSALSLVRRNAESLNQGLNFSPENTGFSVLLYF